MKKMMMMIGCFLLGMTALCHAQGGMRMNPADRAKQLQTQLKLSDDQTAKITAIYQKMSTKMDSLRTAGADRSAMRPLMMQSMEQVKTVLTPDQAAAFQKIMDERRSKMQEKAGNSGSTN